MTIDARSAVYRRAVPATLVSLGLTTAAHGPDILVSLTCFAKSNGERRHDLRHANVISKE